jgi:hypothetical protein
MAFAGSREQSQLRHRFRPRRAGAISRLDVDGLLAWEALVLADKLFEDDALIFLRLNSRSLRFGAARGGAPALKIAFDRMPQLTALLTLKQRYRFATALDML